MGCPRTKLVGSFGDVPKSLPDCVECCYFGKDGCKGSQCNAFAEQRNPRYTKVLMSFVCYDVLLLTIGHFVQLTVSFSMVRRWRGENKADWLYRKVKFKL